ncbi:TIGR02680 family protein [Nocardia xishanensis]|uniref:TIGR02680 family protein n=1 Tax=Nocardia xishanensis TaxID=238964 RepID=UPI0033E4012F
MTTSINPPSAECALPQPDSRRWKPLRAGLVDLFYYDQQEFRFRDGRLLLRGNNGAGKSKVLALLLPFLLDGDLAPHRVEPDADPRKRMEWNLLLGGAHPHPERIGYSWMEFGRIDDDGTARFCTIGCGMKAVAGRGIAAHWYFVSTARVGEELRLLDGQGYPLGRDRLGEQLIGNGERYDTATAYRRAVDEALFGLGELRYGALVDLLIRLRQPQLSKKPSEKVLSQALTESLPPLDQAILADVAEAFRSLQEDRDELGEMKAALHGTTSFLGQYREYARVACRRKTTRLRQTHSRYEQVGRELGDAKNALTTATETEQRLRADKQAAEDENERLVEHRQALDDSEAADAARELEKARESAEDADRMERDRAADRDDAQRMCDDYNGRVLTAEDAVARATTGFETARQQSAHEAARAALAAAHEAEIGAHLDRVRAADPVAQSGIASLRRAADRVVAAQTTAVKHVRGLIAAAEGAQQRLVVARNHVDKLDTAAAALAEAAEEAERRIHVEATELTAATSAYLRGTTELVLDDLAGVLDELAAWALLLSGESPARTAVSARVTVLGDELTRAVAAVELAESTAAETRHRRQVELDRLREGGIEYPPTPHTRADPEQGERDGAPLWRLISFADEVSDDDRAGVEAALEASGVLDAWVSPDGRLRTGSGEVIVSGADPAPGRTLAEVTVPAIDPADLRADAVSPAAVATVLAAIGLGADSAHHTWVDISGRFHIGVLDGKWHKPAAQYIGAVARERFRLERISALESEIAAISNQLDELAAQRRTLDERKRTLRTEAAGLPSDDDLCTAHRRVSELAAQQRKLADDRAESAAEAAVAESAAHAAAAERDRDAADAGLPPSTAALDEITEALADYRVATGALWSAAEQLRAATEHREQTRVDAEAAGQRLIERAEAAEYARLAALRARQRYNTLNATVGADVAQLQADLRQVAADLKANRSLHDRIGRDLEQALIAKGEANGKLTELTAQLDQERTTRDDAITGVRRFAETGLFQVALTETRLPEDQSWSAAAAVSFARAVDVELADVAEDEKTLERVQRRVAEEHKALADLLSAQGNSASMTLREEGIVVEVVFRGRPVTVTELAATLAGEVGDRDRLLTEREREVLENHLVDEVASALQELILAAEAQVLRMNGELESRPTSTGMRLRLNWVPSDEAPAGAKAALHQLRRTADVWNEADRAAVGEFLQREIERVRTENLAGTWLEHLTTAFDYRRWNKFVIELQQRGQWRSATGPASGGERVLAASVPLFAAASAHYASAGIPHAPRLVMLDEAFAGVDDNARAKYLGLLAAFDLDVVMTSEREWGCYPEVPGLAIAQLARTDDVAAVLVTPWEWDGNQRRLAEYATTVAPAPRSTPDTSIPDGLF